MSKFAIKSFELNESGDQMYSIDEIIRSLQFYEVKYGGIVKFLNGNKTVKEIIDEM